MPSPTYTPLASITLTSATPTVSFSDIQNIYRDLVVVARTVTAADQGVNVTFNGDTSGNYSFLTIFGTGTSGATNKYANSGQIQTNYGFAGAVNQMIKLDINNYASSNKQKSVLIKSSIPTTASGVATARWASLEPINTITFRSSSFLVGSTFSVYGIL